MANKTIMQQAIIVASVIVLYSSAAYAVNNTVIVDDAVKQIKTFLLGDARRVIDLGLLGSGAAASLIRSSWTPVVSGGLAMAIYEILVSVIK
jgi:hypothetical protein